MRGLCESLHGLTELVQLLGVSSRSRKELGHCITNRNTNCRRDRFLDELQDGRFGDQGR